LLETEIDDKKGLLMRYSADVAEINSQKQSLKSQVDEYEQKIKSLILDLEA